MSDKWQVIKKFVPVGLYDNIKDAEKEYYKYDCDLIRRVNDEILEKEKDSIYVRYGEEATDGQQG